MIEKTVYVCELCGEEFETKEDCRAHEMIEATSDSDVVFYNEDGKRLSLDRLDEAMYIDIFTDAGIEYVKDLAERERTVSPFEDNPDNTGFFFWDDVSSSWLNWEIELSRLKNINDFIHPNKATGIIRRIDDLGRVVIPKDVRHFMNIQIGDPFEISTKGSSIILNKYTPME